MVDQNPYSMAESNYIHDEDIRIDTIKARFRNVMKRHAELTDRLSRDSDKMVFERLQKEFEAARASQTQEIYLEGEDWNDGLLATIRERVHMEADRKATAGDSNMELDSPFFEKITYRVGSKRWWATQDMEIQEEVRNLIDAGQLEFINGGWVMHDEAASHYIDMIDQTTLGHRCIREQFNKTSRAGWQIDPFGHSAVQAYLIGAEPLRN